MPAVTACFRATGASDGATTVTSRSSEAQTCVALQSVPPFLLLVPEKYEPRAAVASIEAEPWAAVSSSKEASSFPPASVSWNKLALNCCGLRARPVQVLLERERARVGVRKLQKFVWRPRMRDSSSIPELAE